MIEKKPKTVLGIQTIPSKFNLEISSRTTNIVRTDVVETGVMELQTAYQPSHVTKHKSSSPGSISLFLKKDSWVYALTNMHIYGQSLIPDTNYYHSPISEQNTVDVLLNNGNTTRAYFEQGVFNETLDIAIARLKGNPELRNYIPNHGHISAYLDVQSPKYNGYKVQLFTRIGGRKAKAGRIHHYKARRAFLIKGRTIHFKNLIQIRPRLSERGDSGALLFVSKNNQVAALGILIGADQEFSYVIPIRAILYFFGAEILITN